jgi:hypothetical protein
MIQTIENYPKTSQAKNKFVAHREMYSVLYLNAEERIAEKEAFTNQIHESTFEKIIDLYRARKAILQKFPESQYEITFFENIETDDGLRIFDLIQMYHTGQMTYNGDKNQLVVNALKNQLLKNHESLTSKLSRRGEDINQVNDLLRFSIRSKKPMQEIGGFQKIASDMVEIYKLLPDYWQLNVNDFEVFVNEASGFSKVDIKFTAQGLINRVPYTINLEIQYDTVANAKALKREHVIFDIRREIADEIFQNLEKVNFKEKNFIVEIDHFIATLIEQKIGLNEDLIKELIQKLGSGFDYDKMVVKILKYKELYEESINLFRDTDPSVKSKEDAMLLKNIFLSIKPKEVKNPLIAFRNKINSRRL